MGACASCLGLDRHEHPSSSQDGDLDRILNSRQPSYGAIDEHHVTPPDEGEMRREREVLEHITATAANQMIDVIHPTRLHLDHSFVLTNPDNTVHDQHLHVEAATASTDEQDAEEAAWLESIQSASLDTILVQQSGNLTMDLALLRAP